MEHLRVVDVPIFDCTVSNLCTTDNINAVIQIIIGSAAERSPVEIPLSLILLNELPSKLELLIPHQEGRRTG